MYGFTSEAVNLVVSESQTTRFGANFGFLNFGFCAAHPYVFTNTFLEARKSNRHIEYTVGRPDLLTEVASSAETPAT